MESDPDEKKLVRPDVSQKGKAELLARERVEQELAQTKEALERKTIELAEQREWFEVALSSIGDAVITTDAEGKITFLNLVAATMTGWKAADAIGQPLEKVVVIINEMSRQPVENPVARVLRDGIAVGLANQTALVSKDGGETSIEDSASPIKDAAGKISGAVMVFHDVTNRRRAEVERERFIGVLERSLNEIYIFHPQTLRFEYVNEGARRNLGYTMEAMREMTPLDLKPEFTEDDFQKMVKPLVLGEKDKHIFHTVHQRKDGSLYPVEVHLQLVMHESRQFFLAVILDVTERKKAEEELRRNEDELRVLANSIPQLAWIAKADGHIFWYNHRWFEYTGATLEQMEGWGWQSVHNPQILPRVVERWKQSINTGQPFEMEFPLRGADGIFRWFLTRVNPVRDAEGRVVRWFGTNTDVDEVKRAREALQEETHTLELLNKIGQEIASQLDLQKLVQTVTDAGREMSGAKFGAFFYNIIDQRGESLVLYTLSGAPREAFEKFGHPRATPVFAPTFRGEGIVRSGDITQDPRYGKMPPHHGMPKGHLPVRSYLAVPVISRAGDVIGGLFFGHPEPNIFTERSEHLIVGIAAQAAIAIDNARLYEAAQREIADRKRVETELQKAKEELEQRVLERTASLRETTEQLESFCYTIAHDLRSPLRAQQSFAQVLLDDYKNSLDEVGREYAQRIINSAQRLDKLVNDLLTYSRLSQEELRFQKVDLEKVVRDIQVQLVDEIKAQQAQVSVGPLLTVCAYEPTLNLVITNLVMNALKFVQPGVPAQIRIWSERREKFVRLWVEDNGIGIHSEHRHKIFGVFERLHPMDKYPGTGIGLAIVQKGVKRMDGRAGVESQPGQGSRFWIELPEEPA